MSWMAGGTENPLVAVAFGANSRAFLAAGEWWRLIVSMFLHGSLLHLVVNSVALFTLGANIEAFYGPWRFLFLYLMAGLVGSLASAALSSTVSIGASGGVFGLLGASLVFSFRYRRLLPRRVTRIMGTWLLPFLVLNVVLGFVVPRIDTNAHFGGLAAGAAVAMVVTPRSLLAALGSARPLAPRFLPWISAGLLVASFAGAAQNIWRTRGPNGPVLAPWKYDELARMERESLEQELRENPDSRELLYLHAQIHVQREEWVEAVADYRKLLELDPDDAQVLNNLAWALLEEVPPAMRNRVEAGSLARRALELEPADPYVLGTYGTVLLRNGDAKGAAEHLEQALALQRGRPGEETDRYLLAIALAGAGRPEEAAAALARARRGDPGNDYRREAEAAVEGAIHTEPAL